MTSAPSHTAPEPGGRLPYDIQPCLPLIPSWVTLYITPCHYPQSVGIPAGRGTATVVSTFFPVEFPCHGLATVAGFVTCMFRCVSVDCDTGEIMGSSSQPPTGYALPRPAVSVMAFTVNNSRPSGIRIAGGCRQSAWDSWNAGVLSVRIGYGQGLASSLSILGTVPGSIGIRSSSPSGDSCSGQHLARVRCDVGRQQSMLADFCGQSVACRRMCADPELQRYCRFRILRPQSSQEAA